MNEFKNGDPELPDVLDHLAKEGMSKNAPVTYSADMVLFAELEEPTASVLLIRRGGKTFHGWRALPGGHVETGRETGREAALRETEEEVGIAVDPTGGEVLLVGVYDKPGRDPRGLVVSVAYTATLPRRVEARAGDDASRADWAELRKLNPEALAFDHGRMVCDALALNGLDLSDFQR